MIEWRPSEYGVVADSGDLMIAVSLASCGTWFCHVRPMRWSGIILAAKTVEEAKVEAVLEVRDRLQDLLERVEAMGVIAVTAREE
jgi:hypothetical protein